MRALRKGLATRHRWSERRGGRWRREGGGTTVMATHPHLACRHGGIGRHLRRCLCGLHGAGREAGSCVLARHARQVARRLQAGSSRVMILEAERSPLPMRLRTAAYAEHTFIPAGRCRRGRCRLAAAAAPAAMLAVQTAWDARGGQGHAQRSRHRAATRRRWKGQGSRRQWQVRNGHTRRRGARRGSGMH